MIRILKLMRKNIGYILLVFVLLAFQAWCDLSLPEYTSKIVDIGITRKGIKDLVPEKIRKSSLDELFLLMDYAEKSIVLEDYALDKDFYALKPINSSKRLDLNNILSKAWMFKIILNQQKTDVSRLSNEQLSATLNKAKESLSKYPSSIMPGAALKYIQAEYEALGINTDTMQMNYLINVGSKMLLRAGISAIAAVAVGYIASKFCAMLERDLRSMVYKRVMSFSSNEMNRFSTASLITRTTNDITQVQTFVNILFKMILYAPLLAIGGIVKVAESAAYLQWILVLCIGFLMSLMLILFVFVMPKFKLLQGLVDRINLISRELLTGVSVIRAFGNEGYEEKRFDTANKKLAKTHLFVNNAMAIIMPIMMFFMNGIAILIIYSGAHGIDEGRLQVGEMMAFIEYSLQIIISFLMIASLAIFMPRALICAKRINEVLDTTPDISDKENLEDIHDNIYGELEFRNVSFKYEGAKENVLTDISFSAKKGETVAIIGSTGSGKSTVVNLLPRFFDVSEGAVLIDGVDIRDIPLNVLREKIGFVPQKSVLFSGTVRSNLQFGNENATDEKIWAALNIAQASEFVEKFEDGLNYNIAQGGSNLSGGQRQRLAIARAVVKNPEFYVFDDSFSALDFKTDAALRKALKAASKDATVLIVAQRVSTIMTADKILVLEAGSIVGAGKHEELLKTCEVYRNIAESQLRLKEVS